MPLCKVLICRVCHLGKRAEHINHWHHSLQPRTNPFSDDYKLHVTRLDATAMPAYSVVLTKTLKTTEYLNSKEQHQAKF